MFKNIFKNYLDISSTHFFKLLRVAHEEKNYSIVCSGVLSQEGSVIPSLNIEASPPGNISGFDLRSSY